MIPVMVLRNKSNHDKYLAHNIDVSDRHGEVTIAEIQHAYLIVRTDLQAPTTEDFEAHKEFHAEHKAFMIERYGPNAFISLDFEAVCEAYEPINIEISQEQYETNKELWEE